ncbi:uncharacterized protein CLUP02_05485 [Colletotrichum lupini]|uniref:Uncharacterized protein n=1 Tax=Colletotrichum lupini TaxID=145971 RepID=A0A9Q8WE37_9PEZI|nr:uncharacterized protein CLUP02_05485 [Colletotrichum lupini]UQC80004.1 hypothetical protein CLUP02_05485 [Colletotrichum lupini]
MQRPLDVIRKRPQPQIPQGCYLPGVFPLSQLSAAPGPRCRFIPHENRGKEVHAALSYHEPVFRMYRYDCQNVQRNAFKSRVFGPSSRFAEHLSGNTRVPPFCSGRFDTITEGLKQTSMMSTTTL